MFVVSGTPDAELRDIVGRRSMAQYFEAVCGSPRRKEPIIEALLDSHGLLAGNCLFIGDAMTDFIVAEATGLAFIGRVHASDANPFPVGTRVVRDSSEFSD